MHGAWHDFDTTPSSWVNIEEEAASMWEPLYDLWSWWLFKFSEWRWRERGQGGMTKHMWLLFIPLIFLLAWRVRTRSRVRRIKTEAQKTRGVVLQPGADSEFYLIEKRLIESGYTRHPWVTLSRWISRIEEAEPLRSILALHYRYRFDPKGITADEKAVLKSDVRSWLEVHEKAKSPDSHCREYG